MGSGLFGAGFRPDDVIGETLRRITPERIGYDPVRMAGLTRAVRRRRPPRRFEDFAADPLTGWIEEEFEVHVEEGRLVRAKPIALVKGSERLAAITGVEQNDCKKALAAYLEAGNTHSETPRGIIQCSPSGCTSSSAGETPYTQLPRDPPNEGCLSTATVLYLVIAAGFFFLWPSAGPVARTIT